MYHVFAAVITLSIAYLHVQAVNVCQTQVFIGDVAHVFHTESLEAVDSAARSFCGRHVITAAECERIKRTNRKDCYGIGEEEESAQSDSVLDNSQTSPVSTAETTPRTSVDYSTKVGPVLPVFGLSTNTCPHTIMNELNGIIVNAPRQDDETEAALARACAHNTESNIPHHLQTYVGEEPRQAVRRFCGMMNLPEYQCKQIRAAFFKLHNIDMETEETVGLSGDDNAGGGGGATGYWVNARRLWKAYFNYAYRLVMVYSEKYASALLLLTALAFVGLQVHG
jgi:hypothetical protein